MKRIFCVLLCVALLVGIVPTVVSAVTTVTHIEITDVREPVDGNGIYVSAACDGRAYDLYGIDWFNVTDNKFMEIGEKFVGGKTYRADVWVEAQNGYEFSAINDNTPNVSGTINGKTAKVTKAYEYKAWAMVVLSVNFVCPQTVEKCSHTLSAWRTTGAYHYKVCTTCGEFLVQEDHKGGVATCAEKGVCTVCGYAYLETTEDHVPDTSKWISRGERYHFHKCSLCGAHCDIGDHNPGPDATETTPQTCKDCGYVMAPAKNHVHDLGKVPGIPATCTEGGNIEYYVCVGCMNCYTDAEGKNKHPETETVMLDPLGHSASEDFKFDEEYHWRTCTRCGIVLDETKMAHELIESMCTSCEYVSGTVLPEVTPEATPEATLEPTPEALPEATDEISDEPEPTDKTDPKEKETDLTVLWIALIIGGAVLVGAIIPVIIIKIKKK